MVCSNDGKDDIFVQRGSAMLKFSGGTSLTDCGATDDEKHPRDALSTLGIRNAHKGHSEEITDGAAHLAEGLERERKAVDVGDIICHD